MGLHRKMGRNPSNSMHARRTGGRVSLFNYNPSIAGGKIAIKRFKRGHRMGHLTSHHRKVSLAAIPELMPNVSSHAANFMKSGGKVDERKRVRSAIAEHMDKMNKRMRM